MEVIHPRVAGIDVHKKIVWVAVRLPGERPGERTVTAKRFKTFWRSLRQMAAWLSELGVTDVAMESTGVYWWPVYHALAQAGIEVCVCNAAHMRNVPGVERRSGFSWREAVAAPGTPMVTAGHAGSLAAAPRR
jgi:transposase